MVENLNKENLLKIINNKLFILNLFKNQKIILSFKGMSEELKIKDCQLYIVILILMCISIIVTTLTIIFLSKLKKQKDDIFFMEINLFISAVINIVGYCLNYVKNEKLLFSEKMCKFQSLITFISSLSIDFWICIITYCRYYYLLRPHSKNCCFFYLYYFLSFLFPLIIGLILYFLKQLGKSKIDCSFVEEISIGNGVFIVMKMTTIMFNINFSIKIFNNVFRGTESITGLFHKITTFLKVYSFPILQLLNGINPIIQFYLNLFNHYHDSLTNLVIIWSSIIDTLYPLTSLIYILIPEGDDDDVSSNVFEQTITTIGETNFFN